MKKTVIFFLLIFSIIFIPVSKISSSDTICPGDKSKKPGAYYSGKYSNIFTELLDISDTEVQARVNDAWNQLFYGDDITERVYYPVDPDMAYIKDIIHNDVRTEGMSYGMMIAVQLDKKAEFDRLWKWAKTYMQYKDGQRKNYFSWELNTAGNIMDNSTAPDGEE